MFSSTVYETLAVLPLSQVFFDAITNSQFDNIDQVLELTPAILEKRFKIPADVGVENLRILSSYWNMPPPLTLPANEYPFPELNCIKSCPGKLKSMAKSIDDILEGGLSPGLVTEIFGPAGAGKTQLCLQFCLTIQLPIWCHCMNGDALYIDTEGSFIPKRVKEMAAALVQHYDQVLVPAYRNHLKSILYSGKVDFIEPYTTSSMMDRIMYRRVHNCEELIELSEMLKNNPPRGKRLKLIIVDSIAMPFRYEEIKTWERNSKLLTFTNNLKQVAKELSAIVVFTNQVSTKINDLSSSTIPALGTSWGHICSIRLAISMFNGHRRLQIAKHPGLPSLFADYNVTPDGIRDVD